MRIHLAQAGRVQSSRITGVTCHSIIRTASARFAKRCQGCESVGLARRHTDNQKRTERDIGHAARALWLDHDARHGRVGAELVLRGLPAMSG